MSKDRSLVRASDLGSWAFCHRAWWLREVQDAQHANPAVLAQGNAAHKTHGRQVQSAQRQSKLGLILVAIGLITIGLLIIWQMMG